MVEGGLPKEALVVSVVGKQSKRAATGAHFLHL